MEAFKKIKRREADFTVANRYLARMNTHNECMSDDINFSDWVVIEQPMHLAMSINSPHPEPLNKIDELLIYYRKNRLFDRIHQTYMKKWIHYGDCEAL